MFAGWLRKKSRTVGPNQMIRLFNFYVPFIGAGIKVRQLSPDYRHVRAELLLTWYNRNYVGTQFGGSIYSLADPFLMIMLMRNLGPEYMVWDKAAYIEFVKPGRTKLTAEFTWTQQEIDEILKKTASGEKLLIDKLIEIRDCDSEIIAQVTKTLYIRRKKYPKENAVT